MKTNFLKYILLLVVFTTILSCSKDNTSSEPDPKTFQYRVKEIQDENGNFRMGYEYNSNNQVTKRITTSGSYLYYYNTSGFLYEELQEASGYRTRYSLDQNGKVLEEIRYDVGNNPMKKTAYSYNNIGSKTEEKYYDYVSGNYNLTREFFFYYNSKNQLVGDSSGQEYEYDERGNQIKIIYKKSINGGFPSRYKEDKFVYDNIKPAYYKNSTLSMNNQIEYVTTNYLPDGVTVNTQSTNVYRHTYNEASYITKTTYQGSGNVSTNYILEKIN
jgi:hypothetical protein